MNFLRDLALAHQKHEGYYYNTPAYRNNNPGNLRGIGGAFIHFATYEAGLAALMYDLKVKIFGTAGSVQRYMKGSGKKYEQLVFQDYVSIYAPSEDFNDPVNYCTKLCADLPKYNLKPDTPLSIMAQLVRGQITSAPDPPSPPIPLEARRKLAQNALRFANQFRRPILLRLIDRLNELITKKTT